MNTRHLSYATLMSLALLVLWLALTANLFAQSAVHVSLPTAASNNGTNVTMPITAGNTSGRGIIAFDATITYNAAVLQAVNVTATGLTQGWSITANTSVPGQIRIAAFNAIALSGSGSLLNLTFTVVGTACAESALTFANFVFNEGDPPVTTTNGTFKVTPCSAATAIPTPTTVSTASPTHTPTPTRTATPSAPGTAIYLSTSANGRISSLAFSDEDILRFDPATANWQLVFDGSDVGVGNGDVDAFDLQADGSIVMSFEKPLRMTIAQQAVTIDDADLVRFTPTQLGPTTAGSFARFFTGATVGLTTAGENIDAVDIDDSGRLLLSTSGSFTAGAVRGGDEDLFAVDANHNVTLFFDGSAVALTAGSEDLNALWVAGSDLYLATKGAFNARGSVNTISGSAQDIFVCQLLSSGTNTDCRFATFFMGGTAGLPVAIDGIHIAYNSATNRLISLEGADDASADDDGANAVTQFAVVADPATADPAQADAELDAFDQPAAEDIARPYEFFMPLITAP